MVLAREGLTLLKVTEPEQKFKVNTYLLRGQVRSLCFTVLGDLPMTAMGNSASVLGMELRH